MHYDSVDGPIAAEVVQSPIYSLMNREQIALGLVLRAADIPISIDSFHDRLSVQKAVYLLEQAGLDLGYPFNWYVRGPYSRHVASDLYALVEPDISGELRAYKLTDPTCERIRKVSKLWTAGPDAKAKRAQWLELLASVLFLIRTRQADTENFAYISEILRKNQKDFSVQDVKMAVEALLDTGAYEFLKCPANASS
jgi:uncharacterized protein YwgA